MQQKYHSHSSIALDHVLKKARTSEFKWNSVSLTTELQTTFTTWATYSLDTVRVHKGDLSCILPGRHLKNLYSSDKSDHIPVDSRDYKKKDNSICESYEQHSASRASMQFLRNL